MFLGILLLCFFFLFPSDCDREFLLFLFFEPVLVPRRGAKFAVPVFASFRELKNNIWCTSRHTAKQTVTGNTKGLTKRNNLKIESARIFNKCACPSDRLLVVGGIAAAPMLGSGLFTMPLMIIGNLYNVIIAAL